MREKKNKWKEESKPWGSDKKLTYFVSFHLCVGHGRSQMRGSNINNMKENCEEEERGMWEVFPEFLYTHPLLFSRK